MLFELYTDTARQALFFARIEAGQLGGNAIEPAHLLLGLLRAARGLDAAVFAESTLTYSDLLGELHLPLQAGDMISPSVELPFSAQTQRVLELAARAAVGSGLEYVAPAHLLLGLLSIHDPVLTPILNKHNLTIARTREIAGSAQRQGMTMSTEHILDPISTIKLLVQELSAAEPDSAIAHNLVARIFHIIDSLPPTSASGNELGRDVS